MILTPKYLRELRRYLRKSMDGIQDVVDVIGKIDADQVRRLKDIIRNIRAEVDEIDRGENGGRIMNRRNKKTARASCASRFAYPRARERPCIAIGAC